MTSRHTGKVKFFKENGWGFIIPDDPNINRAEDLFVHISGTNNVKLERDQRVSFALGTDKKTGGSCAIDVEPLAA